MAGSVHDKRKSAEPDLFEGEIPGSGSRPLLEYAVMHCDGASSGNPGESGIGIVIDLACKETPCKGFTEAHRFSEYIGLATNNIAEYSALLKGLKMARSLGVKKIKIFLDSELVVRQINGQYKVRHKNLLPLWVRATNALNEFDEYKVSHVPREMNSEADSLAREAVKKKKGHKGRK